MLLDILAKTISKKLTLALSLSCKKASELVSWLILDHIKMKETFAITNAGLCQGKASQNEQI